MQPIVGTIRALYNSFVVNVESTQISSIDYRGMALQAESELKFDVAEECWRRSIEFARKEKQDAAFLNDLLERMSDFYDKTHRFDLAIRASLESFTLKQTAFGTNSTTVAAAANGLASLYFRAGDATNAVRYGLLCLQGMEKNFGPLSESVALACLNLATMEISRRNYETATEYLARAQSARIKVYGERHDKTAQVAIAQANLLKIMYPDTEVGTQK